MISWTEGFLGSNEERADELYRYLTVVKFFDLERKDFDELMKGAHDPERWTSIDMFLKAPIDALPVTSEGHLEQEKLRRYWFEQQRSTYLTLFQSAQITDWSSQELKYDWLQAVTKFTIEQSPYEFDAENEKLNYDQIRILVHGAGIGDEVIALAHFGFKRIHYNDIGGSETTKYALRRLESRSLWNVREAPVKLSFDPLGRGIYQRVEADEQETGLFDLIISCNVFGWVKHPMYTIMNLGRLLTQDGVLAVLPSHKNYPLEENEWMMANNLLVTFLNYLGFVGYSVTLDSGKPFYPVFKCLWASHNKYKEEWIL